MNDSISRSRTNIFRACVSYAFFANGFILATWAPQIPIVKARLGLSDAELGLNLLCMAIGAVCALSLTGWLINRFGSRLVTAIGGLCFVVCLPLPVLASSPAMLAWSLGLFGACNGVMDVAMNGQAVLVEKIRNRPIMSSFHGLWSVGGLIGAALGSLALSKGLAPAPYALAAVALAGVPLIPAVLNLVPKALETNGGEPSSGLSLPGRPMLALCALAFMCLMSEGVILDWATVFMADVRGSTPAMAGMAFSAFATTMALGRFMGDRVVMALGPVPVARWGSALAASGLGVCLFFGSQLAALAGFAMVGLGVANTIPLIFSAAGRTKGVAPGAGIAAVATIGYLGLLSGPPIIGFVAEATSLSASFALTAGFMAIVAASASTLRRDQSTDSTSSTT